MKFLVTGSSGLIGSQFVFDLEKSGQTVYSCYNNNSPLKGIPTKLDLLDLQEISNTFQKIQPDAVIHLAALTDVERCEAEPKLANSINTKATEKIVKESEKFGCFLIYLSTDYVFDGKNGMYNETSSTNPINQYAKTKLFGEKAVMDCNTKWSIIRTSTPFGINSIRKTFPIWIIENIKINKMLNLLEDQFTSPTYVPNLSKMVLEVLTRNLEGIFHLSGSTRISRYEFGKMIAKQLNLDKSLLKPVKMDMMTWKAKRPHDSSFDVSKANSILTEKPYSIEKSLQEYIPLLRDSFSL